MMPHLPIAAISSKLNFRMSASVCKMFICSLAISKATLNYSKYHFTLSDLTKIFHFASSDLIKIFGLVRLKLPCKKVIQVLIWKV